MWKKLIDNQYLNANPFGWCINLKISNHYFFLIEGIDKVKV